MRRFMLRCESWGSPCLSEAAGELSAVLERRLQRVLPELHSYKVASTFTGAVSGGVFVGGYAPHADSVKKQKNKQTKKKQ